MKRLMITLILLIITSNVFPAPKKTFIEPYTKMTFVFIEGGCFEMGDVFDHQYLNCRSIGREKIHKVCLKDFYLGQFEVTIDQWNSVMHKQSNKQNNINLSSYYPITNISWLDIKQFLDKLNERHQTAGYTFRLPSEGEWEYACREKGKKVKWGNGKNTPDEDEMNCRDPKNRDKSFNEYQLMPVGQFTPNSLGLYDMAGNAGEWVIESLYEYPEGSEESKPIKWNPNLQKPMHRGGAYIFAFNDCSCSRRFWMSPEGRYLKTKYIGFRLVMEKVSIK